MVRSQDIGVQEGFRFSNGIVEAWEAEGREGEM